MDQKNIEDSCRLFLSKVAVLNTVLPVHSCGRGGGKKGSEQLRFCLGETPSILESEGASILLATCPSSQRQFIYPFPFTYTNHAHFEHLALPLRFTGYKLHAQSEVVDSVC